MMSGLHSWLLDKSTSDTYMFIKRLSANDIGATGGHQVGRDLNVRKKKNFAFKKLLQKHQNFDVFA